jgi:parallel beta-helix repeat protein
MRTSTHRRAPGARVLVAAMAVAAGWGSAGAATAAAAPAVNLHCGEEITASVTLTGNLTCHGDGLIVDPYADVTLDLGGHTITGDGTGTGVTLSSADVAPSAYTVTDGTIAHFATGVSAGTVDSIDVSHVRLARDTTAIFVSPAVFDVSVTGSSISGAADVLDAGSARSLDTLTVTQTSITGGTERIVDGLATAFYTRDRFTDSPLFLNTGGDDQIEHNVFENSELTEQSSGTSLQIIGNTMDHAAIGFLDESPGLDTISGNTFHADGIGAEILEAMVPGGDTITRNTFSANKASGLYVDSTSDAGTITSNTAVGNGSDPGGLLDASGHLLADGITVDQPSTAQVTITGNRTASNGAFGIWVQQGGVTNGGSNTSTGIRPSATR